MFSGITESKVALLDWSPVDHAQPTLAVRIKIQKPDFFNDLSVGDSISVNGVCLTVESFNEDIQFFLGAETLKITGWTAAQLRRQNLNVERSMRNDSRVHGHFVTGHVDGVGQLIERRELGNNLILRVEIPPVLAPMVWQKGSVAINGVSLTVNSVEDRSVGSAVVSVGLIPETLKRTNLGQVAEGEWLAIEVDQLARALQRFQMRNENVILTGQS